MILVVSSVNLVYGVSSFLISISWLSVCSFFLFFCECIYSAWCTAKFGQTVQTSENTGLGVGYFINYELQFSPLTFINLEQFFSNRNQGFLHTWMFASCSCWNIHEVTSELLRVERNFTHKLNKLNFRSYKMLPLK